MPKKKKTKSHEEKTAENFFRVDSEDLDRAIEKPVKEPLSKEEILKKAIEIPEKIMDPQIKNRLTKISVEKEYKKQEKSALEKVEVEGKSKKKRRTSKKKNSIKKPKGTLKKRGFKRKEISFKPKKVLLKKDSYELIITEKPQAALKIASALGPSVKRNFQGVPYYDVSRDGKQIVVACAVGHLFTLSQTMSKKETPVFDIGWVPNYFVRKSDFTKKYLDLIERLAKNAGSLTVATDYDVEGEVIGLNVVRFACGQKDARRMKFSTLTKEELNKSYESKRATINWGQAIAGETRHYLDWYYGINLSRALMSAIKTTGRFRIMSIGRVQGPTLNLIVEKEKEIQKFKPRPYWQIFIKIRDSKNQELELKYNKDIFNKEELGNFKELEGKTATAKTKKTEQKLPPNPPFNLTTLQTETYKFYGITPTNTLRAAQSLYLTGLISYPRTSSQKLPPSIGYKEILKKLSKAYGFEHLTTKKDPIEGKKSDPAHPSIYPTGQANSPILTGDEEKVYNLIVKRFLSLFCEDAIIDNKKVSVTLDEKVFSTKGSKIRKKSWLEIYPYKLKEEQIPDIEGEVEIIESRIEEKTTQPPKRYSPASIISELEKRNLGTKATRASILETLYDRGYIKEKSIEATPLGMSLIGTLEKHSPIIIDENLTRHFEEEMEKISETEKKFEEKGEKVMNEAKKTIIKISEQFVKEEKEIGKELLQANEKLIEQQKIENTLTKCPVCKKGNLTIKYSKKTRRHFVACDSYPNCNATYSLPPNGIIKKIDKKCPECDFPQLMSLRKGKKPWIFCFNKECPSNKERLEEYYRKKEETENSTNE